QYSSHTSPSADELDRMLMQHAIQSLGKTAGTPVETALYSDDDWLWLRRQVATVRQRLSTYRRVALEIPGNLTDGPAREVIFERAEWSNKLARPLASFGDTVLDACRQASVKPQDLQGCLVCGTLLNDGSAPFCLRSVRLPIPVEIYSSGAVLSGIC